MFRIMLSPGRTDVFRFIVQTIPVWTRRLTLFLRPSSLFLRMEDFDYLSDSQTLRYLAETGYGLCRFGNSELTFIAGRDIRHQRQDSRLRNILVELIAEYNKVGAAGLKTLLALPLDMTVGKDHFNRAELSLKKRSYRKEIWRRSPLHVVRRLSKKGATYGSPSSFRFRDCVPSEGLEQHLVEFIRLMRRRPSIYVGPLLDHETVQKLLPEVEFIEIPPREAFSQFDDLLEEIMAKASDGSRTQVLITAGLTGTALSYKLNKSGITAMDVGQSFRHIAALVEDHPTFLNEAKLG